MKLEETPIPGLVYLDGVVHSDHRGAFLVGWRKEDLAGLEGWKSFVQESISTSRRGVLRGLHLQHPRAQGKLIRVLAGEVFDVAVDLRAGSETRRQVLCGALRPDGRALWIPPGFAHGFLVCSDEAVVLYQVTAGWAPRDEHTVRWDDADLAIPWPLTGPPILSARDAAAPGLAEVEALLS